MAMHGSIGEFDSTRDDWKTYSRRLDYYFAANDVQDADKKKAIFLSASGSAILKLIGNLVAPQDPSDFTYKDLCKKVSDYYDPKPSRAVQRHMFHSRVRKSGETVAAFVAEQLGDCFSTTACLSASPALQQCFNGRWRISSRAFPVYASTLTMCWSLAKLQVII